MIDYKNLCEDFTEALLHERIGRICFAKWLEISSAIENLQATIQTERKEHAEECKQLLDTYISMSKTLIKENRQQRQQISDLTDSVALAADATKTIEARYKAENQRLKKQFVGVNGKYIESVIRPYEELNSMKSEFSLLKDENQSLKECNFELQTENQRLKAQLDTLQQFVQNWHETDDECRGEEKQ